MECVSINRLPVLLENNQISEKEAVNSLAEFLCLNYPLFGLQNYSDDFRSDILVKLLEKGSIILKTYQKEKGEFFNYFYCYILTMIRSEIRSVSRKNINDKIFFNHCAEAYPEYQYSYSKISADDIDAPKIPYNFKPISADNLKAAFHSLQDREAKKNIILALKAAFYLNDQIIDDICSSYNLDKNDFLENIQLCKNTLLNKNDRNQIAIERRNQSYFYHKRYEYQLDKLDFYALEEDEHIQQLLEKKNKSQEHHLQNQNQILFNQKAALKTSNKMIADILDLCERQVGYYLLKAKESSETEESKKED